MQGVSKSRSWAAIDTGNFTGGLSKSVKAQRQLVARRAHSVSAENKLVHPRTETFSDSPLFPFCTFGTEPSGGQVFEPGSVPSIDESERQGSSDVWSEAASFPGVGRISGARTAPSSIQSATEIASNLRSEVFPVEDGAASSGMLNHSQDLANNLSFPHLNPVSSEVFADGGFLSHITDFQPPDAAFSANGSVAQGKQPGGFAGKSSGSGLLREPTSGGVQSATSTHGLPDEAVAVRNLVAQSKQAHLCTIMSRMHHRRMGYPFASTVDFANDASGHPIFTLSSLAIHARNLLADPRCSLVVQIPGWSGLADARVTIFGEVYPVAPECLEWAKSIFSARHRQQASQHWGNRHFFRMEVIRDIYFVGGFGTVAWVDADEYMSVQPDKIASEDSDRTLQILNSKVSQRLKEALGAFVKGGAPVDAVTFIAVDGKGVDIRVQQGDHSHVRRLSFNHSAPIDSVETAETALENLLLQEALPSGLVDQ